MFSSYVDFAYDDCPGPGGCRPPICYTVGMNTIRFPLSSLCLVSLGASAGIFDDVVFRAATDKAKTVAPYLGADVYTGDRLPTGGAR